MPATIHETTPRNGQAVSGSGESVTSSNSRPRRLGTSREASAASAELKNILKPMLGRFSQSEGTGPTQEEILKRLEDSSRKDEYTKREDTFTRDRNNKTHKREQECGRGSKSVSKQDSGPHEGNSVADSGFSPLPTGETIPGTGVTSPARQHGVQQLLFPPSPYSRKSTSSLVQNPPNTTSRTDLRTEKGKLSTTLKKGGTEVPGTTQQREQQRDYTNAFLTEITSGGRSYPDTNFYTPVHSSAESLLLAQEFQEFKNPLDVDYHQQRAGGRSFFATEGSRFMKMLVVYCILFGAITLIFNLQDIQESINKYETVWLLFGQSAYDSLFSAAGVANNSAKNTNQLNHNLSLRIETVSNSQVKLSIDIDGGSYSGGESSRRMDWDSGTTHVSRRLQTSQQSPKDDYDSGTSIGLGSWVIIWLILVNAVPLVSFCSLTLQPYSQYYESIVREAYKIRREQREVKRLESGATAGAWRRTNGWMNEQREVASSYSGAAETGAEATFGTHLSRDINDIPGPNDYYHDVRRAQNSRLRNYMNDVMDDRKGAARRLKRNITIGFQGLICYLAGRQWMVVSQHLVVFVCPVFLIPITKLRPDQGRSVFYVSIVLNFLMFGIGNSLLCNDELFVGKFAQQARDFHTSYVGINNNIDGLEQYSDSLSFSLTEGEGSNNPSSARRNLDGAGASSSSSSGPHAEFVVDGFAPVNNNTSPRSHTWILGTLLTKTNITTSESSMYSHSQFLSADSVPLNSSVQFILTKFFTLVLLALLWGYFFTHLYFYGYYYIGSTKTTLHDMLISLKEDEVSGARRGGFNRSSRKQGVGGGRLLGTTLSALQKKTVPRNVNDVVSADGIEDERNPAILSEASTAKRSLLQQRGGWSVKPADQTDANTESAIVSFRSHSMERVSPWNPGEGLTSKELTNLKGDTTTERSQADENSNFGKSTKAEYTLGPLVTVSLAMPEAPPGVVSSVGTKDSSQVSPRDTPRGIWGWKDSMKAGKDSEQDGKESNRGSTRGSNKGSNRDSNKASPRNSHKDSKETKDEKESPRDSNKETKKDSKDANEDARVAPGRQGSSGESAQKNTKENLSCSAEGKTAAVEAKSSAPETEHSASEVKLPAHEKTSSDDNTPQDQGTHITPPVAALKKTTTSKSNMDRILSFKVDTNEEAHENFQKKTTQKETRYRQHLDIKQTIRMERMKTVRTRKRCYSYDYASLCLQGNRLVDQLDRELEELGVVQEDDVMVVRNQKTTNPQGHKDTNKDEQDTTIAKPDSASAGGTDSVSAGIFSELKKQNVTELKQQSPQRRMSQFLDKQVSIRPREAEDAKAATGEGFNASGLVDPLRVPVTAPDGGKLGVPLVLQQGASKMGTTKTIGKYQTLRTNLVTAQRTKRHSIALMTKEKTRDSGSGKDGEKQQLLTPNDLHAAFTINKRKGSFVGAPIDYARFQEMQSTLKQLEGVQSDEDEEESAYSEASESMPSKYKKRTRRQTEYFFENIAKYTKKGQGQRRASDTENQRPSTSTLGFPSPNFTKPGKHGHTLPSKQASTASHVSQVPSTMSRFSTTMSTGPQRSVQAMGTIGEDSPIKKRTASATMGSIHRQSLGATSAAGAVSATMGLAQRSSIGTISIDGHSRASFVSTVPIAAQQDAKDESVKELYQKLDPKNMTASSSVANRNSVGVARSLGGSAAINFANLQGPSSSDDDKPSMDLPDNPDGDNDLSGDNDWSNALKLDFNSLSNRMSVMTKMSTTTGTTTAGDFFPIQSALSKGGREKTPAESSQRAGDSKKLARIAHDAVDHDAEKKRPVPRSKSRDGSEDHGETVKGHIDFTNMEGIIADGITMDKQDSATHAVDINRLLNQSNISLKQLCEEDAEFGNLSLMELLSLVLKNTELPLDVLMSLRGEPYYFIESDAMGAELAELPPVNEETPAQVAAQKTSSGDRNVALERALTGMRVMGKCKCKPDATGAMRHTCMTPISSSFVHSVLATNVVNTPSHHMSLRKASMKGMESKGNVRVIQQKTTPVQQIQEEGSNADGTQNTRASLKSTSEPNTKSSNELLGSNEPLSPLLRNPNKTIIRLDSASGTAVLIVKNDKLVVENNSVISALSEHRSREIKSIQKLISATDSATNSHDMSQARPEIAVSHEPTEGSSSYDGKPAKTLSAVTGNTLTTNTMSVDDAMQLARHSVNGPPEAKTDAKPDNKAARASMQKVNTSPTRQRRESRIGIIPQSGGQVTGIGVEGDRAVFEEAQKMIRSKTHLHKRKNASIKEESEDDDSDHDEPGGIDAPDRSLPISGRSAGFGPLHSADSASSKETAKPKNKKATSKETASGTPDNSKLDVMEATKMGSSRSVQMFEQIDHEDLHQLLTSTRKDEVMVIDTRGKDFVGGHIPGSVHIRAHVIQENPDVVITLRANAPRKIVFTCMYSVLRANQCCAAVQERLQSPEYTASRKAIPKLYVLAQGFHGWLNYWLEKGLLEKRVEDYNEENWVAGGDSKDGRVHMMDALWSYQGQQRLLEALKDISSNKERW